MNGTGTNGTVLSKIQKLLKLAEGTPYEGESQAAMAKAMELMAQHRIEMKDVELIKEGRQALGESEISAGGMIYWYKKLLSRIVAENFRCDTLTRIMMGGYRKLLFIGLQEDIEIAVTVYRYAFADMRGRCLKLYRKQTDRNAYMFGYCDGLKEQFKRVKGKYEMVLVKPDALVEYMKKTTSVERSGSINVSGDGMARAQGMSDGSTFGYGNVRMEGGR